MNPTPIALALCLLALPDTPPPGSGLAPDHAFFGPATPSEVPNPNTPQACAARRARVASEIGTGVLAIAAGGDVEGRFQADALFHWLTGVSTPDTVLLLEIAEGAITRERLYLPERDPGFERWNGARPAPGADSEARFGIAETAPLGQWRDDLGVLLEEEDRPYVHGELIQDHLIELAGEGDRLQRPASRLLRKVAAVRELPEQAAIHAAVDMTQQALAEAFRVVRPGNWEFQAEAAIEGGYRSRGAFGPSFPSIVGSGPNSCYLHYRSNERQFQAGDLVVMDVGARYANYCADVTRTIPVSGTFTERQREVYDAVWAASIASAATLKPGSSMNEAHRTAKAVLDERGFGSYFIHSVGHGLGLYVHDDPGGRKALEPGMVVTIEPGVYIADEELGVRIENDWLITEDGAVCLSDELPSDPDALLAFLAEVRGE
ncbi:MAG: Xaa-Pro peptidase family protein [Planctomycetota bacterium]|nr:Xaa-Pro peptidase family protein [Planctomycetota bacterium]